MKHRKITLPKAKRLFDITSSFCILLVLSPLVLVLLFIGLIEQFFSLLLEVLYSIEKYVSPGESHSYLQNLEYLNKM